MNLAFKSWTVTLALVGCNSQTDILEDCRNTTAFYFEPSLSTEGNFTMVLTSHDGHTYRCHYPYDSSDESFCELFGGRGIRLGGVAPWSFNLTAADEKIPFWAETLNASADEVTQCTSGDYHDQEVHVDVARIDWPSEALGGAGSM